MYFFFQELGTSAMVKQSESCNLLTPTSLPLHTLSSTPFTNGSQIASSPVSTLDNLTSCRTGTNIPADNGQQRTKEQNLGALDGREFVCGWGAAVINITCTFPMNKIMFRQVRIITSCYFYMNKEVFKMKNISIYLLK